MVLTRNIFDDTSKTGGAFVLAERYLHTQANQVFDSLRGLRTAINVHNVSNWTRVTGAPALSGTCQVIIVDEYLGYATFIDNSTNPETQRMPFSGINAYNKKTIAGTPASSTVSAGATNGAGVQVVGLTVSSATASKFARSSGGGTWTVEDASASSTSDVLTLLYDPVSGQFIAGISPGEIETSSDGNGPWTSRTVPGGLSSAVWLDAVANEKTGDSRIIITQTSSASYATSTDGVTWSTGTFPASGSYLVTFARGAASGNGLWYAADAAAGNAYTSTNGTTWTAASFPPDAISVYSVHCMGDLFVAVVDMNSGTSTANVIWYSQDGTTWHIAHATTDTPTPIAQSDRRMFFLGTATATEFSFTRGI